MRTMAPNLDFPAPQPFEIGDKYNNAQRWTKWQLSFEYYMAAVNITEKAQNCAVRLHIAGEVVQTVFEALTDMGNDDTAIAKLKEHFEPLQNVSFERHVSRPAGQAPPTLIADCVTQLRHGARCDFDHYDAVEEIKD